jgi:hypothetical protein
MDSQDSRKNFKKWSYQIFVIHFSETTEQFWGKASL